MNIEYFFILGFAPGVFWLIFFYKRDILEKEPKSLILWSFVLGIYIAIPAASLESLFHINKYLIAILVAPIVEELLKFLVIKSYCYPKNDFNEPMDGIVYGAAVALGFASIENVSYLYNAYSQGNFNITFVARAFLTVPGHALFTCMGGYALGIKKIYPEKVNKYFVFKGLLLAMLLHALFNFIAVTSYITAVGLLILIFIMWKLINKRITHALDISPFAGHKYKKS